MLVLIELKVSRCIMAVMLGQNIDLIVEITCIGILLNII